MENSRFEGINFNELMSPQPSLLFPPTENNTRAFVDEGLSNFSYLDGLSNNVGYSPMRLGKAVSNLNTPIIKESLMKLSETPRKNLMEIKRVPAKKEKEVNNNSPTPSKKRKEEKKATSSSATKKSKTEEEDSVSMERMSPRSRKAVLSVLAKLEEDKKDEDRKKRERKKEEMEEEERRKREERKREKKLKDEEKERERRDAERNGLDLVDPIRKRQPKNQTARTILGAYLHLHDTTVTLPEQNKMLHEYLGRENELWTFLENKYGANSVPQVIKDKYAPALNNQTMLIKLIPKTTVAYNETIRAMKAAGFPFDVTLHVDKSLSFETFANIYLKKRWEAIDRAFSLCGYEFRLWCIYSDVMYDLNSKNAVSAVIKGKPIIEYGWVQSHPASIALPPLSFSYPKVEDGKH